jgi:glyoxalase family protein
MALSTGIHHITAITGNPQKNLDFYEGFLGQRLVKRTVNFDDPRSYHFYFGDAIGTPGTLLTFFYFGQIPAGTRGTGEVRKISYSIPKASKQFWQERAKRFSISCIDSEHVLCGFYGATLAVTSHEEMLPALTALGYKLTAHTGQSFRFMTTGNHAHTLDLEEVPDAAFARQGSGSVHHIAFRATTDTDEMNLKEQVEQAGLQPTGVIDRNYFHSVYFQTPSRILFEIATDAPGMSIDESAELLGEKLVLPEQYEPHRAEIEKNLVPIILPRHGS